MGKGAPPVFNDLYGVDRVAPIVGVDSYRKVPLGTRSGKLCLPRRAL